MEGGARSSAEETVVPIRVDSDIVAARHRSRGTPHEQSQRQRSIDDIKPHLRSPVLPRRDRDAARRGSCRSVSHRPGTARTTNLSREFWKHHALRSQVLQSPDSRSMRSRLPRLPNRTCSAVFDEVRARVKRRGESATTKTAYWPAHERLTIQRAP